MTNEKRLIKVCDATVVYNGIALYMAENAYINDTALDVLKMVASWINEAPTVDAVEVVHGRWVWDVETHGDPMYGIDEDFGYRCSECQVWADEYGVDSDIYEEPPTHILRYCPNCGAKMDGDANV